MRSAIARTTICPGSRILLTIVAIAWAVVWAATSACAGDIQWNGGFSAIWQNVNNWDPFGSPISVHRVPGDTDTATLSTPAGDTVVLEGDTAPINGILITNGIDLLTNGFLLEVDDTGSATTAIAGNGTSISVAPRTGGGTAFHTDGLFISGDGLLNVDGGDVQIDGMTTMLSGGQFLSVAGGAIHFGGDVLAADSQITAAPVSFSPGITFTAESNALVQLLHSVNVIDGMTFEVHTGAQMEPISLNIGNDGLGVGSAGTVVVDSASMLDIAADLTVGHAVDGSGLLHVVDAGTDVTGTTTVLATGAIQVEGGSILAFRDDALVDGGTIATTNTFFPIFLDAGVTLTAANDGEVTINGIQVIGDGTTFQFNSGADLSVAGNLQVGNSLGPGTLSVDGSGSTLDVGGEMTIGRNAPGSNATLTNGAVGEADSVVVGQNQDGELTIESGAVLTTTSLSRIGANPGGSGDATVRGAGSSWTAGSLHIGEEGDGSLLIIDGASVTSGTTSLGVLSGFGGIVTVNGPGSTFTTGSLTVGHQTIFQCILSVLAGGSVTSTSSFIGRESGSDGRVSVSGSFSNDSTWTVNGRLSIGGDAISSQNGGEGALTISPHATVNVTQDIVLFPDGLVALQGGTLTTTEVSFDGGGEFDWNSGTLHVETFNGNLLNEAGTLAPGLSAGGTTVIGDYIQQASATMAIEIGGTATATEYDFVNVTGTAMLGGELELTLINDFLPDPNDEFIVLNADVDLLGFFTDAGNNQRLDTTDGLGSFLVHYGPTSAFDPDQIVLTAFVPSFSADFDEDGDVDNDDLVLWEAGYGTTSGAVHMDGDADGDLDVDGEDFLEWQQQFGSGVDPLVAVQIVPEPSSLLLLFLATNALVLWRQTKLRALEANVPETT